MKKHPEEAPEQPKGEDGLRANFRAVPFWNPTKIFPHELDTTIHRMDLNECPYPPSPIVLEAMREAALGLNRYPDGTCPTLTARLSERTAVPVANICWGAGSTQLLTAASQIAVDSRQQLVVPGIVWRRFTGIFHLLDADVVEVPNRESGAIDVEGLLRAIGNNTRLVVVLTPNNPTGLMLDPVELQALATRVPENVLLFIDEAYHEFALHAGGSDPLPILQKRRGPWVITRTFSKAYALAGLRLGYALCSSEEIANAIRLTTSTFNLSGVAESAALAALDDPSYAQMILDQNAIERDRIIHGLRSLGYETMDSATNFISFDARRPADELVRELRERGVRVATWGYQAAASYVRVSTGLPEDTDAFLRALRELGDSSRPP